MSLASRSEHSRVVVSTTCDAQVFLEEHLDDIVECLASYFETWDNAGWINADEFQSVYSSSLIARGEGVAARRLDAEAAALCAEALGHSLGSAGTARVEAGDDDDESSPAAAELLHQLHRQRELAQQSSHQPGSHVVVTGDVDALRASADGHGGGNERMRFYASVKGEVTSVDDDGDCIVRFRDGKSWALNPISLSACSAPRPFRLDDVVRVWADVERCTGLNNELGFTDRMHAYCGTQGTVVEVQQSPARARVRHADGRTWLWSPVLLEHVTDEVTAAQPPPAARSQSDEDMTRAIAASQAGDSTTVPPPRPPVLDARSESEEQMARAIAESLAISSSSPATASAPQWQWDCDGVWQDFDTEANGELERMRHAHSEGHLTVSGRQYLIMAQGDDAYVQISDAGFERAVRRVANGPISSVPHRVPPTPPASSSSETQIARIMEAGFSRAQAIEGLRRSTDPELAMAWIVGNPHATDTSVPPSPPDSDPPRPADSVPLPPEWDPPVYSSPPPPPACDPPPYSPPPPPEYDPPPLPPDHDPGGGSRVGGDPPRASTQLQQGPLHTVELDTVPTQPVEDLMEWYVISERQQPRKSPHVEAAIAVRESRYSHRASDHDEIWVESGDAYAGTNPALVVDGDSWACLRDDSVPRPFYLGWVLVRKELRQTCQICFEDLPITTLITLPCDHRICKVCINGHIEAQLEGRSVIEHGSVRCFQPDCDELIDQHIVRAWSTPDQFTKYLERTARALTYGQGARDTLVECPRCSRANDVSNLRANAGAVRCAYEDCRHYFCLRCRCAPHEDEPDCEKARIRREETKMRDELPEYSFQCSNCDEWQSPDLANPGACDRGTCGSCGHQMCIHCLEPMTANSPIQMHGNHYHQPGCRDYREPGEGEERRCRNCPAGGICSRPGPSLHLRSGRLCTRICPCSGNSPCNKDPGLWGRVDL